MTRSPTRTLLPRQWPEYARTAVLHVISLASTAATVVRSRWATSRSEGQRRRAGSAALQDEIALLVEELRIKDERMSWLAAAHRPHYRPLNRMAILELRARRGWSIRQTARRFLVEPRTVASWMKRLDEGGERSLVQTPVPVNKYPDFVRYIVQRLRVLCPTMGRRKIAEVLARAGLHLGATTVRRMTQEGDPVLPEDDTEHGVATRAETTIIARAPHHVWGVDLTAVPTGGGFWTMLPPYSWLQRWPFCYWLGAIVDHYSRRAIAFVVFRNVPTARDVTTFLDRAIQGVRIAPRSIVSDRGKQFACQDFRDWCRSRGVRPRYGAVGKHGSIAVVERFIRTLKTECARRIHVSLRMDRFRAELAMYFGWFNQHRPHRGRRGRTPDEVNAGKIPACERGRYEPRVRWPRHTGCAAPWAEVRGPPAARLRLNVRYLGGRRHLPIVSLRRVA